MPLAFTARDIVHVLLTGLGIVVVLHLFWPNFLRLVIRKNPEVAEEFGEKIYLLAGMFVALMYVLLVRFNKDWGIWDAEPALTALVATVAIMFGYGQLMTSPYFPSFEQQRLERKSRLSVEKGQVTNVRMIVHNTGIVAWKDFRISLEAEQEDGIAFTLGRQDARGMSTMNNATLVQKNASLLAVGEPAVLTFDVLANKVGEFRLRVKVATDLRPGEKRDRGLKLIVSDATPHSE